ncbi:TIGR02301 family protein [Maritalea porphyrae]|jgi:uncharacterized protein (TIGR02301 family)|uniref:TIGR02301 family protein n=1 Tax=Maritalea porphyrae TaxID=880732 RepID=UPI0022B058A1|nr:TIGR02301 family protein [Maritalea porphyrae]MCZ4271330.1 TIGR02301 family protein [Maritalea porphyrae]
MMFTSTIGAHAVDPPYQQDLQRFATIMGALYHLDALCLNSGNNWRDEFAELLDLEEVDEDRRARLTAAFNSGYYDFNRMHVRCTPNAQLATKRFIAEGAAIAKNIHTRFAE